LSFSFGPRFYIAAPSLLKAAREPPDVGDLAFFIGKSLKNIDAGLYNLR
jgi:hypothetical protein